MTRLVFLTLILLFPLIAVPAEKHKLIVAIIDTGLDTHDFRFSEFLCKGTLNRDFTGEGIADKHGHGTHIAGIIVRRNDPSKFCIVVVKVFNIDGDVVGNSYSQGLFYLRTLHADIVNMSLSGKYFNEEENILVHENPMSRFVAAAGNDGVDLETNERYPANLAKHYSNVIAVGNLDERGIAARGSNYGLRHMIWMRGTNVRSTLPSDKYGYMSGTSQAAANATNALIRSYDRSTDSFSNLSNLEKGI